MAIMITACTSTRPAPPTTPVSTGETGAMVASDACASLAGAEPDTSVAALRALADRCPRTPRGADALAQVGDAELEAGHTDAALDAYLRVVCPPPANAPAGPIALDLSEASSCIPWVDAPEANGAIWARIGQIYFDAPDLPRALASFDASLAQLPRTSVLRTRASYLRGWTLFRADRFAEALAPFGEVAEADDPALRDEALSYLGILVAEQDWDLDGRPDAVLDVARPAVRTFLTEHPSLAPAVLSATAQTYFETADFARSMAIDRALLQQYPDAPEAGTASARMTEARARGGL